MPDYWNHNTAYHPMILREARRHPGTALDVGCGDGLLVARLAAVSEHVTGLEPDAGALAAARARLEGLTNVELVEGALARDVSAGDDPARLELARQYDLVTMVAVLHHLDLRPGLRAARALVAPGGRLVVVGLAVNVTPWDWLVSGLSVPVVRLVDAVRRCSDPGVPIAAPHESLAEVREAARSVLPGARVRRGLYYRYVLRWSAPFAGLTA